MKRIGAVLLSSAGLALLILSVGSATVGGATALSPGTGAKVAPAAAGAPRAGPAAVTGPIGSAAPALPAQLVPHVAYRGPAPSRFPASWGALHVPPGAPVPYTPSGLGRGAFLHRWSDGGQYPYVDGTCFGKWPSGGQSLYSDSCIGHDEPAINPFSDLPGSGGNVSWSVSLPVDRNQYLNQSDNYIAIWFGMDLNDPFGYNGQCFLELQMYPDTNANFLPQVGKWTGFVVAWQIELATGFEDPCIAAPLNQKGTHHSLEMNAGDHLYVNMTGWPGSHLGERLSVVDTTHGSSASMRLVDSQHHFPLNPAYSANNVQDSLPWSPGGDLPVAFAFESGHTITHPQTNLFGGCSSGAPPPTSLNPSVPCGSYNPRAWALDTRVPWHFYPVVFFNAHARQTAVQYGFEQDFGAAAWIDGLSFGACTGRDGSAWCSYPWFSYAASQHAFEFGATDYAGTSEDFGQYHEYDASLQTDSSGLNFYPVRNFTVPDPSGASLTIAVQGSGTVRFLNYTIASTTTLRDLPPGAYSINAVPAAGNFFQGYRATSGVALDAAATAWSGLRLSGTATLTATFGPAAPPASAVSVADVGAKGGGFVTSAPGFAFSLRALYPPAESGFGLAPAFASSATNVPNGGTLHLFPGIYSFQANPPPGYNFTGWSARGGAYVFTPESNYTWVNVTSGSASVVAHYSPTHLRAQVFLATDPSQGGSIRFGPSVRGNGAVVTVRQGTYAVSAIPKPGYRFVTWAPFFMATMTNFSSSSDVLVQYGQDWLTAVFSSTPVLTRGGSGSEGAFALNGSLVHGHMVLPQVGNLTYQLEAVPNPGFAFTHWTVDDRADAWVAQPLAPLTSIQVNASATLTPHFQAVAATHSVTFTARGGTIGFNAMAAYSGTNTVSLVSTRYYLSETPAPGYSFAGWSTTGKVRVGTTLALNTSTFADIENAAGTWQPWYSLLVRGAGHVTAHFAPTVRPVSFVPFPYLSGLSIALTGAAGTVSIPAGRTAFVADGTYRLSLSGGSVAGLRWFASVVNLTVASPDSASTVLTVSGSGTVYAVAGSAGGAAQSPRDSAGASSTVVGVATIPVRRP